MTQDELAEAQAEADFNRTNNRTFRKFKYAEGQPGYGPEFCSSCDNEMVTARREYRFHLCIGCAERIERLGKR